MTTSLGRDDRRTLFLTIARTALVSGGIAMADVAASKALALAAPDSVEAARGRLYQGAARTLTDQYEAGIAALQSVDRRNCPRPDATLLTAAQTIALRIRDTSTAAPTAAPAQRDDSAAAAIRLAEDSLSKYQNVQSAGPP